MPQLVTRVDDVLLREVDRLVEDGVVASRSEAVRRALAELLEGHRRRAIGEAIVAGYRRLPQGADESSWSEEATAAMIAEEPW